MKENWPNFFAAGVPKAGTTSLFAIFRNHPDIFTAEIKEPNFFNRKGKPDDFVVKPIRDEKYYLQLYSDVTIEKIICDMSIALFEDPSSCKRILDVSPDAKILICLRDQVERMFSLYLMLKRNGRVTGTFSEELKKSLDYKTYNPRYPGLKLKNRLYAENLSIWQDSFADGNVKVIIFEEFIVDQLNTANEICKFLDIGPIDASDFSTEKHNTYGEPRNSLSTFILKNIRSKKLFRLFPFAFRKFIRDKVLLKKAEKPKMSDEDRRFLQDYFREDTLAIEKILGRKLPWKNFS